MTVTTFTVWNHDPARPKLGFAFRFYEGLTGFEAVLRIGDCARILSVVWGEEEQSD